MRRFVDLHTHSSASDGDLPAAEVVRLAEGQGLAAVALTDHDTLAGLAGAFSAAEPLVVRFVPGIEISAAFTGGILHILGLGIDPSNRSLEATARLLREARDKRNPQMIAKLREMGVDVSMDEWAGFASGLADVGSPVIGRLHLANLLQAKGYVRSKDEAFDRYIGYGGPAFVEKEKLTPRQAIEAIHSAGGVAILAHPVTLNCANSAILDRVVRSLVRDSLDGIEVYHSDHTSQQVRAYLDLARQLELLISGGSDFHGSAKAGVKLGYPRVPTKAVEQLLARITG